jgi:two-component system, cell cycle sensor histidine kinase and response regulator CckA
MTPEKPHSILIVEDERIVATDLQQTLTGMGYDASAIASSAQEAFGRASEKCPDVVLMDIRIKGQLDGIEAAAILRERFDVPIVYLTAYSDDPNIDRAMQTEPYGYLVKPVKAGELRSAIEVSLFRHEMEKRLRERERWFSTTLHSIADAVITVDLAGKVTYMNPAAEVLTGTRVADGVGRPARDVVRLLDTEARVQPDTPLDRALRERRNITLGEADLLGAGTTLRIIGDSASPVVDEGELVGAVMVFRDITEQKLIQKQIELGDRLSSLGTMAAGVAHEVNNPLAVVVANTSFVLEELGRLRDEFRARGDRDHDAAITRLEEALQAQTEIHSAARRIATIVADLKAFARPSQPAGDADVGRVVEWAVRTTAHELRYRARVLTNVAEGLVARADETRLGQVLVNLLLNAAHAISPGSVENNEVSIVAHSSGSDGGHIIVEVSDTGGGMPDDVLTRIFEPFFTTNADGLSTGLGLSVCHGIVSSLGGEIQVESTVGKGSRFRVVLPSASAHPAATAASAPKREQLRGRILVIDDEKLVLRAIQRILRDHEVVCTESAREALAFIERGERFDLILSDVLMPMMTGIEFYELLLEVNPDLARRVVFISGGAITAKVEDFLRSVPNLRIEKPFEVVNMLETIQQLLAGETIPDSG